MILTCKKCETRFHLEDSLLSPGGSKVRCSQCKHIFMAYPDRDSIDPEIFEDIFDTPRQETSPDAESGEKTPVTPRAPKAPEIPASQDSSDSPDFSRYEKILDQPARPEPDMQSADEDEMDPPSVSKAPEPSPDIELPQLRPGPSRQNLSGVRPLPRPPQFKTRPSQKLKSKKALGARLSIILLVVAFLATACAYIASLALGYKIPWLSGKKLPFIEKIISSEDEQNPAEPSPMVSQTELSSRFVSNDTAGELFVITGIVTNPAPIAYRHIQVKGTLLTKDQSKVVTKRGFCGNIVSQEMLKTAPLHEINNLLAIKTGMNGNNTNLGTNATVPFMLVFSNLSETLSNFTVEVEGFEKVPAP